MKVALQLSGKLRFSEKTLQSLKSSIIETLNPDVFCSFWETDSKSTAEIYIDSIKPKLWQFENINAMQDYVKSNTHPHVYANMPYMCYKFYQSSQLRKTYETMSNIKYDVVIQARSDNLFFEKLDYNRCQLSVEKQAILCANQEYYPPIDNYVKRPRMVDNFYLGPTNFVDLANTAFWYINEIVANYIKKDDIYKIKIPEIIQTIIWQQLKVPIDSLPGTGHVGNFWYDIDRQPERS